jgi:HPt (histidine-containing phosphotransfer) domain-containing protein
MSRLNNNKRLYVLLLKKFDGKTMLDDLTTKSQSGDAVAAEASAHTLKGLAANLSLADLHFQAENIDRRLKTGDINVDTADIELSLTLTVEAVKAFIAENS